MAQAGHAFVGVLLEGLSQNNLNSLRYADERPGTKVTLGAPAWRLDVIETAARALSLPVVRIYDRDHIHPPDFDGSPVFTALGFGPVSGRVPIKCLRQLSLWQPQDFHRPKKEINNDGIEYKTSD